MKPDAPTVFGRIYEAGAWGHGDRSGGGSTEAEARPYLELVNGLIRVAGWRTVVDLGCGDGYVTSRLAAPEVIGVDCYGPHLKRLRREHPGRGWLELDLDADRAALPCGDVATAKDVIHHWDGALIRSWLGWARTAGKWRWLVLTQDRHQGAEDCPIGGYRGLDLDKEPLRSVPGLVRLADYLHKGVLLLECHWPGAPAGVRAAYHGE